MFLEFVSNFVSELSDADKVFFSILIGAIALVLIWYLLGKLINSLSAKKKIAAQKELENRRAQSEKTEEPVEEVQSEKTEEPVEEVQPEKTEEPVEEIQPEKTEEPVEEVQPEETEEPVEEVQPEEAEETIEEVQPEEAEEAVEEVQPEEAEEPVEEVQPEETEETVEEVQPEETEEPVEEVQPEKTPSEPVLKKKNTKKTITAPNTDAIKPEVQTEEKKGRTYNGKYEIYQVAGGYAYHLKASNGEILVVSETFSTREGAVRAIDVVKRNLETGTIKFFSDKKGKFKFKLVSKNYRVLLISSNYPTEKGAIRASESFKKFAVKADIVDVDLVDVEAKTATVIQIQNRENKTGGKYHIEKYNGEFSWDLKASNGQILCQADGYTTKSGCLNSIESFKKSVQDGEFKCVKDKTGRYCFKLYTTTGRVCLVGESYTSRTSAESAANSVVAFSQLAEIIEIK